jgi:hypothetical protein
MWLGSGQGSLAELLINLYVTSHQC